MLDAVRDAQGFATTRSQSDLDHDRLLLLAIVKAVDIVGEAAGRVSSETMLGHPQIPWQDIVAMRHRLTHGCYDIDPDIVWNTVTEDLPPLAEELDRVLTPARQK